MKIFRKQLVLTEDTVFNESIKVEGCISGNYNLTVAGDIDAWNIEALDIDARDIKAWNIEALDIDARDIEAWDIKALNIKAGNIEYYAVAFAYYSFRCKSIKGRRHNGKHFCLDKEIDIDYDANGEEDD